MRRATREPRQPRPKSRTKARTTARTTTTTTTTTTQQPLDRFAVPRPERTQAFPRRALLATPNSRDVGLGRLGRTPPRRAQFSAHADLTPKRTPPRGAVHAAASPGSPLIKLPILAARRAQDVDALFDAGDRRLRARDYAGAAGCFERVLEAVPQHPIALYKLAAVSALRGSVETATEQLGAAVRAGFWDREAIEADPALAAVRAGPGYARVQAWLGAAVAEVAFPAPAAISDAADRRAAAADGPPSPRSREFAEAERQALFHCKRSEFVFSVPHWRRAVALAERLGDNTLVANSCQNLGIALHRLGDFAAAGEAYEAAIRAKTALRAARRSSAAPPPPPDVSMDAFEAAEEQAMAEALEERRMGLGTGVGSLSPPRESWPQRSSPDRSPPGQVLNLGIDEDAAAVGLRLLAQLPRRRAARAFRCWAVAAKDAAAADRVAALRRELDAERSRPAPAPSPVNHDLRLANSALEDARAQLEARVAMLTTQAAVGDEERQRLVAELGNTRAAAEERAAAAARAEHELGALREQLAAAQAARAAAEQAGAAARQRAEARERDVDAAADARAAELQAERLSLRGQVAAAHAERDRLAGELARAQAAEQAEAARAAAAETRADAVARDQQASRAGGELSAERARALEAEVRALAADAEGLTAERDTLRGSVRALEAQLSMATFSSEQQQQAARAQAAGQERALRQAQEELQLLRGELEAAQADAQAARGELEAAALDYTTQAAALKEEYEAQAELVRSLTTRVSEAATAARVREVRLSLLASGSSASGDGDEDEDDDDDVSHQDHDEEDARWQFQRRQSLWRRREALERAPESGGAEGDVQEQLSALVADAELVGRDYKALEKRVRRLTRERDVCRRQLQGIAQVSAVQSLIGVFNTPSAASVSAQSFQAPSGLSPVAFPSMGSP